MTRRPRTRVSVNVHVTGGTLIKWERMPRFLCLQFGDYAEGTQAVVFVPNEELPRVLEAMNAIPAEAGEEEV